MTDRTRGKAAGRKHSPLYLVEWIAARGTNKNRLANRIGVNRSTVGKWVQDPEGLDERQIAIIAKGLDCEPADLRRLPGALSLDQLAADLDPKSRDAVINFVLQMTGRKAG